MQYSNGSLDMLALDSGGGLLLEIGGLSDPVFEAAAAFPSLSMADLSSLMCFCICVSNDSNIFRAFEGKCL